MLSSFVQKAPATGLFRRPGSSKPLVDHLSAAAPQTAATLHERAIAQLERWSRRLPAPLGRKSHDLLDTLQHHNVLSFLEDARQPQWQSLTESAATHPLTAPEKKANFITNISLVATGCAALGPLVFWPLRLLSVPILLYRLSLLGEDSYTKIRAGKGMFNVELIEFLTSAALIFQNYLVIAALDNVLFGIARILIEKVKHESRSDMLDVFRQQPRVVWTLVDDAEVETPIEQVQRGDTVVVYAGETIPIDGTVISGTAAIDQHILTGEAQLAEKGEGDDVFALTLLRTGTLQIRVEKTGEATAAAQINQILTDTVDFKSGRLLRSEEIADRAVAPLFALGALAFPMIGFRSSMAVIDSHFKRKTSIAGAISILNYFKEAAAQGILIKDGRTLELLNGVDTVVFDKTGTLTQEQPHVGAIYACPGLTEMDVLTLAAAAEHKQSHPIARAIQHAAAAHALSIPPVTEADYKVGYGLTVTLQGALVCVGSQRFMALLGLVTPPELAAVQDRCHTHGHSLVLVARDGALVGALELRATVRPEAAAVIAELRQRHVQEIYIMSGDHEAPTRHLAAELGVDHYFAQVLPEEKAQRIEQLQRAGKSVCFVGDGINDSIALKTANVSVSLRGASTLAVDTAHVILMDQSLKQLGTLFALAHEMDVNAKQTFGAILFPCVICLGGALFLGFTQVTSIFLNLVSLGLGVTTAMLPAQKQN